MSCHSQTLWSSSSLLNQIKPHLGVLCIGLQKGGLIVVGKRLHASKYKLRKACNREFSSKLFDRREVDVSRLVGIWRVKAPIMNIALKKVSFLQHVVCLIVEESIQPRHAVNACRE